MRRIECDPSLCVIGTILLSFRRCFPFCFQAKVHGECVGAIVCKLGYHKKVVKRGYIAMLAVDVRFRKRNIGYTLVRLAIERMIIEEADEVSITFCSFALKGIP